MHSDTPNPTERTVSVALCTFNGAKYLDQQLRSIAVQTRLPDELVAFDDCSSDGTLEILESFAQNAPFSVRIYSNESNVGYARNFQMALSACTSDIIFPSDQDDIWCPNKIERLLASFYVKPSLQMVVSNAKLVDELGNDLPGDLLSYLGYDSHSPNQRPEELLKALLFGRNFVSGNTIGVRKAIVELLRFIPIPAGSAHDTWLAVVAASLGQMVVIADMATKYRQHRDQVYGAGTILRKRAEMTPRANFAKVAVECESQIDSYVKLTLFLESIAERTDNLAQGFVCGARLPDVLKMLESKANSLKERRDHFQFRSEIPGGFSRIPLILREGFRGRYGRFSGGLRSLIRDLILN